MSVPSKTKQAVKHRVALSPTGKVTVVKAVPGTVSLLDKLKGYYHTLIAIVAAVVSILAIVGGYEKYIPASLAGYIVTAATLAGAVFTFLKSNEHWVDSA